MLQIAGMWNVWSTAWKNLTKRSGILVVMIKCHDIGGNTERGEKFHAQPILRIGNCLIYESDSIEAYTILMPQNRFPQPTQP
jgi:hypothetical protein